MQIAIEIQNENMADKIVKLLELFRDEGVKIIDESVNVGNKKKEDIEFTDEYINEHWKEIGMSTHSAELDDDERLYESAIGFHNEKHSS